MIISWQGSSLPFHLFQILSNYFPRAITWQIFSDLQIRGHFKFRHILFTEAEEFLFAQCFTFIQHHKCFDGFIANRIFNTHNHDILNFGMGGDDIFELHAGDILATAFDHIAAAIDEIKKALFVAVSGIAGM